MTTRYKRERNHGAGKYDAITTAHRVSAQSIMVSALSFFAATIGVGLYSNIDMISSLCILMARGALISMVVVIFVLPSVFMVFDKVIVKTSKGFLPEYESKTQSVPKSTTLWYIIRQKAACKTSHRHPRLGAFVSQHPIFYSPQILIKFNEFTRRPAPPPHRRTHAKIIHKIPSRVNRIPKKRFPPPKGSLSVSVTSSGFFGS